MAQKGGRGPPGEKEQIDGRGVSGRRTKRWVGWEGEKNKAMGGTVGGEGGREGGREPLRRVELDEDQSLPRSLCAPIVPAHPVSCACARPSTRQRGGVGQAAKGGAGLAGRHLDTGGGGGGD